MDLAVSYQQPDGALETWLTICKIIGKNPDEVQEEEDSSDENTYMIPNPDNWAQIHSDLINSEESKRNRILKQISNTSNFIDGLGKIFINFEESGSNPENLVQVFNVYKILLNSLELSILEDMLGDKHYLNTFGALEYNPDIKITESYRSFFKEKLKFNKLGKIQDEQILSKIHLNYRFSYLKDTALATGLEETVISVIITQINHYSLEILQSVLMSNVIIEELIEKLKSDDQDSKNEALSCFAEIF